MKKIILIISVFIISCVYPDTVYRIIVCNKSNIDIGILFPSHDIYDKIYPDTTLSLNDLKKYLKTTRISKFFYDSWYEWKYVFEYAKTDTLSMFIFSLDTVNAYTPEEIVNDYKILMRYDITLKNLEENNYKLEYPPNERMKNIKIFKKE